MLGWVNHDRTLHEGVDVAWDLREVPWPVAGDTCEDILAQDVLEHLPDVVPFMDECWRLLRPGGKLTIRAVLANSDNHWKDPTHVRGFVPESFH
jgi:2-polyprenyl-3-methyl-5-hydroxy-6-metoxy-1,4-benzoquinol methylase